jgi:hypothetical protein
MTATQVAPPVLSNASGSGVTTVTVCGCGQEISGTKRAHCPRCGCCLS